VEYGIKSRLPTYTSRMGEVNAATDDVFRGLALGAMLLVGIGAGWLFLVGGFIRGVNPSGSTGGVLMAAGAIGVVTALIVGQGVVRGARRLAAGGALAQAVLAVLILCWWLATDFWDGTRHAGLSSLLLLLVILFDAVLLVWVWSRWPASQRSASD
jgi:hypothetical protein